MHACINIRYFELQSIRPKLSGEQRQQLQECFELMDQDGSGAIDADELGAAFKLLGEAGEEGKGHARY